MNFYPLFKILSALGLDAAVRRALVDGVKAVGEAIVDAVRRALEDILSSVVTKEDLTASTDKLRREMKAVGDAIQSSAEASKTDLTASTSELRSEINELRGETKAMAAELRGEISSAVNKMLLAQLAIAGLLFAALWILG